MLYGYQTGHRYATVTPEDTASKRLKDPEIARIEDNVVSSGDGRHVVQWWYDGDMIGDISKIHMGISWNIHWIYWWILCNIYIYIGKPPSIIHKIHRSHPHLAAAQVERTIVAIDVLGSYHQAIRSGDLWSFRKVPVWIHHALHESIGPDLVWSQMRSIPQISLQF